MVELKNLTKKYGNQVIFSQTTYRFPSNGLVCLLGASGCGKSTLLNMIAGFDCDYGGEITVCGSSITAMNANELCDYRRDCIGFIFQSYNLLKGYTVLENILLSCELNNHSISENSEKAVKLLAQLHMSDKINQKVENLSGGQKQRVAIARALINDPPIILADEPTGALDRKNATEMMQLLKEIAKDHLVLVITHDKKICEFADHTISIEDGKVVGDQMGAISVEVKKQEECTKKSSAWQRAMKNFSVHKIRFTAIACAIAIGVLSFMLSLSSSNIMEKFILDFQAKNVAFQNGYIKLKDDVDEVLPMLQADKRIENTYRQYIIKNVDLTMNGKTVGMAEKYPMPKAEENMSYGVMPIAGQNKIAMSPSLAKKFDRDINKLLDKEITLIYNGTSYKLQVSGIFNADYDDFFVSCDVEQKFYQRLHDTKPYSISYDVKHFDDVVPVSKMLKAKGMDPKSAAKEVETLQTTFTNLNRLFLIVSCLILAVGLFISISLLVKLQNSRYKEVGLLSALGFSKRQIRAMILYENILLSLSAAIFNGCFILVAQGISGMAKLDLMISVPQIVLSILMTGVIVIMIGILASHKLIHTQPAVALRK